MKVTFTEHEGCFAFELVAESMADAAVLVRFGTDGTKEVRHLSTVTTKEGGFKATLVTGKHKNANNYLPRRQP